MRKTCAHDSDVEDAEHGRRVQADDGVLREMLDEEQDEIARGSESRCRARHSISVIGGETLACEDGDERPCEDGQKREHDARDIDRSACADDQVDAEDRENNADDLISRELLLKGRNCAERDRDGIQCVDQGSHRRTGVFRAEKLQSHGNDIPAEAEDEDVPAAHAVEMELF